MNCYRQCTVFHRHAIPLVWAMPRTQPARWFLYWLTGRSGSGRCKTIQMWLSGFQIQMRPRSRLCVFPTKPGIAQSLLRQVWAVFPAPRVRGAWWGDGESASPQSLSGFNRARWPPFGASLPGCALSHAFVRLQIHPPRAVSVGWRLLCWLKPNSVVCMLPAVTWCPSPLFSWITQLTTLWSKQKIYRAAGKPSVRIGNVNYIQKINPGARETVPKIPSIKEVWEDSEVLQRIIYVCFEASIRGL